MQGAVAATRLHSSRYHPAELIYLAEGDVCARVDAMACYESQLSSFWTSRQNLEESVRQFTSQVGQQAPAERIWRAA